MEIHIHPGKTLQQIQNEFHQAFPFLKIEFFSRKHDKGAPSAYANRLDPHLTLAEAGEVDDEADLRLNGHTRAGQLEAAFQQKFGIGLQVMRRSGRAWILTTLTDEWTLAHQNEEGRKDTELLEAD